MHELRTLGAAAEIVMGTSPPGRTYNGEGVGVPLLNGPTEFGDEFPTARQWTTAPTRLCQKGDVLVCVRGSSTGRLNVADGEYCIGRGVAAIRGRDGELSTAYLRHVLHRTVDQIRRMAAGSTFPNIDRRALGRVTFYCPRLDEQTLIARVLDELRAASGITGRLISVKRRFKRGLMQELLTGRRGFKEFGGQPWLQRRLGDLTEESVARNTQRLTLSRVMAVRKDVGIVPMKEGVASGDLTRYKQVQTGWFAYNPMRINIGSIARWAGPETVLVSPDYVVFRTDEQKLRSEYLNQYIRTAMWNDRLRRAGSGGVRVRVWYDELARLPVRLPGSDEQAAIAALLTALDHEIMLLGRLRDALDRQRRAVAELLLTGKVRVPA